MSFQMDYYNAKEPVCACTSYFIFVHLWFKCISTKYVTMASVRFGTFSLSVSSEDIYLFLSFTNMRLLSHVSFQLIKQYNVDM